MKIHLRTFGCTYNQADSDGLSLMLQKAGHDLVDEASAELVVLNTCSVKDATEQKQLYRIKNESRPLVVTGCLAQAAPSKIQKANPRASLVGTFAQGRISEAVSAAASKKPLAFLDWSAPLQNAARADGAIGRLKISKGCLSACTFCSTKHARGHLESFSISELRKLCRDLLRQGALEIQLASQDCGCFGFEEGKTLVALLEALCSIEGDFRIRVGMGNPEHFKQYFPSLLAAFEHPKVYKFFHLPVQSGSDDVLVHMKRPYSASDFSELAFQFRKRFQNGILATDVIVGYPTETEEDFQKTLNLLSLTRPDMVNVSRFSPRPNTPAARLDQLPFSVINQRSQIVSALCEGITLKNNARFVGKTLAVRAIEPAASRDLILCRSDDYRPVLLPDAQIGSWHDVRIESFGRGYLSSEPQRRPIPLTVYPELHATLS